MILEMTLSAIAIGLATVAPTISLISVNVDQFSKQQMRNSIALICAVGVVLAGSFSLCSYFVLAPLATQYFGNAHPAVEILACVISLSLFFLLSERTFDELISNTSTRMYVITSIAVVFLATTWFLTIGVLTVVMVIYTALSLFDLNKNLKSKEITNSNAVTEIGDRKSEDIVFKHKPNIHILFLESFHSSEALKEIYDIDTTELNNSLSEAGFTSYDNVFSNYPITLHSLSSMIFPEYLFMPDIVYNHGRQPESSVVSTLRKNGYKLNLFANDFLQIRLDNLFNFKKTDASELGKSVHRMFAPLLGQSSLLRKLFSSGDLFESITLFDKLLLELEDTIRTETDAPQLNWFHFGAMHTGMNSWEIYTNFIEKYKREYARAEKELQATVAMLKKVDPDSLIVAIGDHGAHRYRYAEGRMGDEPNETMRSNDFEPAFVAKDHFSVFLGIHWPVGHYTNGEVLSHVRLFDHIFAALAEDKSVLEGMMPNISIVPVEKYGQVVAVRDGVALNEWEPVENFSSLPHLFEQAAKNPEDIPLQLCLVDKLFEIGESQKGLELSLKLCDKFPASEIAHSSAAERLIQYDDLERAEVFARRAIDLDRKSGAGYYCLALIADRKGLVAVHDACIRKAFGYNAVYRTQESALMRYGGALLRGKKFSEINGLFSLADGWVRPVFERFMDWQMVYKSYQENRDGDVYEWLDSQLLRGHHVRGYLDLLTKKIVVCMKDAQWELAIETARRILTYESAHVGAYVSMAHSLEQMGQISEAFMELMSGAEIAQSEVLMVELGAFADRHKLRETSLVHVQIMAREQRRKRVSEWGPLISFDAEWYANKYSHLLAGMLPLEHFITFGNALMLNPNKDFDTAFYYSFNTDVFAQGVGASYHYSRLGKYQPSRPSQSCLYDPNIPVNMEWRSVQPQ